MITLVPNCRVLSATARMLEIHRALEERGAAVRVATRGGMFEWVLRDARVPYDLLAGEESGYLREIGARAVVTGGAEAALRASRRCGSAGCSRSRSSRSGSRSSAACRGRSAGACSTPA
jgi:hypothetical protein